MTSVVGLAAMAAATTATEPGSDEGTAASASEANGVESTTPVMTAPGGTFDQQFCDTWLEAEQTFASSPEDPAELATWYPETAAPIVAELREYAPAEIADAVNTFMDGTEQFATSGDSMALFSPEMSAAVTTIYPSLAAGCGITVVSALLTDYDFGGVPETLAAGPTAFVVLNDSDKGEAHEMVVMRVNDGVDLTIDELLEYPEEEVDQFATFVNEVEAPAPDVASGMVIDLTPGRYMYACYSTEGSVDGAEGTGPPHATKGMGGEFTVA
jgi:hypothetical protein